MHSRRCSTLCLATCLATFLSGGCADESKGPVLPVSADRSYLDGEAVVDGEPAGTLGNYMFNTGVLGAAVSAACPQAELKDLAGVNLDLSGFSNQLVIR